MRDGPDDSSADHCRAKNAGRKSGKLKKSIQVIKKLKDRLRVFSKKSAPENVDGGAVLARSAEAATKPTNPMEMSRSMSMSRTASRSLEPTRNMEQSSKMGALKSMELTAHGPDLSRSIEPARNSNEEFRLPDISRSAAADVFRNTDGTRAIEPSRMTDISRSRDISRSAEVIRNADFSRSMMEASKSYEPLGRGIDGVPGRPLINDSKSPPEKTARSPPRLPGHSELLKLGQPEQQLIHGSAEDMKTLTAEPLEVKNAETEKLADAAIEDQLASLNRRLKVLVDENERANKRDGQLFAVKNQIIAKVELVKKQMEEAMDLYRGEAQTCREKIEKEEIYQNQTLMDLKERVEKLSDMCTDINNQVDEMMTTLNTYSFNESGVCYMVAACSVDLVVRFFQLLFYSITYITGGCPEMAPTAPAPATAATATAATKTTETTTANTTTSRKKHEKATTPPNAS